MRPSTLRPPEDETHEKEREGISRRGTSLFTTATARSAGSGGPRSGGHGKVLGMEDDSPFLVTCEQLDP